MRKWTVLWLASLVVVAGFTSVFMRAQAPSQVPPPVTSQAPPEDARVISGSDIGFRVENINEGRFIGRLVDRDRSRPRIRARPSQRTNTEGFACEYPC